ncbi:hypothetical protein C8R44DRAFT_632325, partial [Mycena epipterygia]
MGKILWHQFNTVVILRQNMRQTEISENDTKLRTVLENMRYGACTDADIEFLQSRIAGQRPQDPKLNDMSIRKVSIITARNSQKDMLNKLGSERFARDTGQPLIEFFSVDRLSSKSVERQKWKNCPQSDATRLSKKIRETLWEAMPSTVSEFVAGKLALCMGMPVMLRANDAPEMCITKGQEAEVVGWDCSTGPSGQNILDTLFVELMNPPRAVQIEGLPLNVVPIVRTITNVTVLMPDDTLLSIVREQV